MIRKLLREELAFRGQINEIDWENTFSDVRKTCVEPKAFAEYLNKVRANKDKKTKDREKFDAKYPFIHAKSSFFDKESEQLTSSDVNNFINRIIEPPTNVINTNDKILKSGGPHEYVYKTGIPAFRGLAYSIEKDEIYYINTCPGAGDCVLICYALKGNYIRYAASYDSMTRRLNYLLNFPEKYEERLYNEIKQKAIEHRALEGYKSKVVLRWNDSGDFFGKEYVNMAERVAGPYYLHASGYSLFLVTTLPILIYKISKEGLSFFRFICLITGLFILLRTGSRAGLIGFLISLILVYRKRIFNKYTILFLFISLVSFRSQLLEFFFDNPLLKRFVYLFKNGIFDASSNERVEIIIRSINGLDSIQRFYGIGIGYFDNFQESIVGERIAAHNNFLLFFIEGGLFLLIFFIIHLVWIAVKISKVKDINKRKLLVLLFLNIELFGIINNNLYYYIPYLISLLIIHEFISEKKWKSLKY